MFSGMFFEEPLVLRSTCALMPILLNLSWYLCVLLCYPVFILLTWERGNFILDAMWRKQNQKTFILLTWNVSMMKIFVSGKCSFHSADGLWKEAETLAQMFLLNNSVTWRHEKYADNIHKTNLHAFGFVEMCTCYITGNMWWFGFFYCFCF